MPLLLAKNLTSAPVTITVTGPEDLVTLYVTDEWVNVTSELADETPTDYAIIDTYRTSGQVIFRWDGPPTYSTPGFTPLIEVVNTTGTATGTGEVYAFVFRPGGVQIDNVYTSFSDLITAMLATDGPKLLSFDDSLAPCSIPAGVWGMTDVTWVSNIHKNAHVTVPDGASFPGLRAVSNNLRITFSGITPPVSGFSSVDAFVLDSGSEITTSGAGPFILFNGALTDATLILGTGSRILTGTSPVVRNTSTASVGIVAGNVSVVESNTLSGTSPIVFAAASSSAYLSETQTSLASLLFSNQTKSRHNPTAVITTSATVAANDLVQVDPSGGSLSITLPLAFNARGQSIIVKNITTSTNTINISTSGGDLIDGVATVGISIAHGSLELRSNGATTWSVVGVGAIPASPDPIVYSFVFRPGGSTVDNVYSIWSDLVTATTSTVGDKQIVFDSSITPCIVPTGTWNMGRTVWLGALPSSAVEVQNGAILPGLRRVSDGLAITFSGTTPAVADFSDDIFILDNNSSITTSGAGPFIRFPPGMTFGAVHLDGMSKILTGTVPVIKNQSGTAAMIVGLGACTLESDTLIGTGGNPFALVWSASAADLSENQPSATVAAYNLTRIRFNTAAVITSNSSINAGDIAEVDPTGGPINITMPPAFNNRGIATVVKNITGSSNSITILPSGADTIDGSASYAISIPKGSTALISNGSNRWVTFGTDAIIAGAGLTRTGNTIDVVANADGSIVANANDIKVGILATDAQHGNRGGGSQHALAIAAGASGFMSGADKTKLDGLPSTPKNSVLIWGNFSIGTSTTPRFLSPGYEDTSSPVYAIQYRVPSSGTVKNFRVRSNTAGTGAADLTFTVTKNGSNQSVTCTYANTAQDGSDLVNTFSVSAGDLIDIAVTKSATLTTSPVDVMASLELAP